MSELHVNIHCSPVLIYSVAMYPIDTCERLESIKNGKVDTQLSFSGMLCSHKQKLCTDVGRSSR